MMSNRFSQNLGLVLAVFGTLFALYAYFQSRQFSQITYSINHESLYRPSHVFDTSLILPNGDIKTSQRVVQTVLTIWNGGNVAFKGEDARAKLTLSGDSSVILCAHKVISTKILPGSVGFTISSKDNSLEIDWRIFDPGEAIQITVLSTGNSESLGLSGRYQPGQKIVRFPTESNISSIALIAIFVVGLVLLAISSGFVIGFTEQMNLSAMLKKYVSIRDNTFGNNIDYIHWLSDTKRDKVLFW